MRSGSYLKLAFFNLSLWGYPLISIWVSDTRFSQILTIPYRALVLFLSLLIIFSLLFHSSKRNNQSLKILNKNPFLLYIACFFVCFYSLRILNDTLSYNNLMILIHPSSFYLMFWFLIGLVPSFAFIGIDYISENSRSYLMSSLFVCFIILIQFTFRLNDLNQVMFAIESYGRVGFEAINPISIGVISSSAFLISLYSMTKKWFNEQKLDLLFAVFLYFLAGLALFFLLLSASRGPTLSTISCFSIFLFSKTILNKSSFSIFDWLTNLTKVNIKYFILIFVILLGLVFVTQFLPTGEKSIPFLSNISLERLLYFRDYYDETNDLTVQAGGYSGSRKDLFAFSLKIIMEEDLLSFLIGYGLELPGLGYPHNLVVEAFLSTGIIGGTLFLIMFIRCFIKSIKILINNNTWGWLGLLYIQYAVQSFASGSLYTSNVFWHLSFILICLPLNGEKKYFLLPPQNPVNIS